MAAMRFIHAFLDASSCHHIQFIHSGDTVQGSGRMLNGKFNEEEEEEEEDLQEQVHGPAKSGQVGEGKRGRSIDKGLTLQEKNRLAQQKFRAKKKIQVDMAKQTLMKLEMENGMLWNRVARLEAALGTLTGLPSEVISQRFGGMPVAAPAPAPLAAGPRLAPRSTPSSLLEPTGASLPSFHQGMTSSSYGMGAVGLEPIQSMERPVFLLVDSTQLPLFFSRP